MFDACEEAGALLADDGVEDAEDGLVDDCLVAAAKLAELTAVTAPRACERKMPKPSVTDEA